ncbi:hypothetical protein N658DRAFT_300982 [Parathielavia hyrcaniae]|uniref:Uncharacterized protein n=1 Tax=Parathielavia hyrcaniae TaxID=113614 RepID=A0AAN6Q7C1_9PEZI|nr:hypothetical protein N658DRAFT_300982 [Parathielavia hyrcaniae]
MIRYVGSARLACAVSFLPGVAVHHLSPVYIGQRLVSTIGLGLAFRGVSLWMSDVFRYCTACHHWSCFTDTPNVPADRFTVVVISVLVFLHRGYNCDRPGCVPGCPLGCRPGQASHSRTRDSSGSLTDSIAESPFEHFL